MLTTAGKSHASLVVIATRTEPAAALRHGLELPLGFRSVGELGLGTREWDPSRATMGLHLT
jgi:hypothetical protein